MTPGTIFQHQNFRFHDGAIGNKILIVLGSLAGATVVVKTTSRSYRFSSSYGCQPHDRFQNFHLVQNCCILPKATWVCLDEYYEFSDAELLALHFAGEVKPMGDLPNDITAQLVACALASNDISMHQENIVQLAILK
jgi:hypothetical protein